MATATEVRDTEVVAKAKRRRFSAEYKRRILQEAEKARSVGEIGALLRREGLYSSHLTTWRAARTRGEFARLGVRPVRCSGEPGCRSHAGRYGVVLDA
jgi:transposase-like protein